MNDMPLNYHLMHPGGDSMPGDPNAAFYLDGVYHLHYILRHPWKDGESYSFVHVTSTDMLHWDWQTTKRSTCCCAQAKPRPSTRWKPRWRASSSR